MTIPIVIQEVSLPDEFNVRKRTEKGVIAFEFSSPVALPYDNGSLQQYQKESQGRNHTFGPSLEGKYLTDLTHAVLKATLPEFTGKNGFYKAGFDASGMYGFTMLDTGNAWLTHSEDQKPKGRLTLQVHSAGHFFPVLTDKGVERPTIDKGTLIGKVYLDVNIPHPKGGDYIYYADVGAAIVVSLVYNQPLTLQGKPFVGFDCETGKLRAYVQVENPTLERMQAALAEEKVLAKYFAENIEPIKDAAEVFAKVKESDENYREKVFYAHRQLSFEVEQARKRLSPEIPVPASIDDTIAQIDKHINAKLKVATDSITHLSAGFPRKLFEYASAENVQR